MAKRIILCILMVLSLINISSVYAQEGGKIYLDLKDDYEPKEKNQGLYVTFIKMGKRYIDDVVEYDELLEDDAIRKDFSDDFKIKYKDYNEQKAEDWERYVRNGVKAYRFYKDIKSKIIEWLMEKETALVVDDSQYEMGEKEEYIESDETLVIENFKKVVAYSNLRKDRDAVADKLARDKKEPTPSEIVNKYKKLMLEQKWLEALRMAWGAVKKDLDASFYMESSIKPGHIKSMVLPEYEYVNEDGKIRAVINVELMPDNILLFNKYKKYDGIKLNFEKSENIKNVQHFYMRPKNFAVEKDSHMTAYKDDFAIFFEAEVVDKSKPIIIKPSLDASVCYDDICEKVTLEPLAKLEPSDEFKNTTFVAYVITVAMNIEKQANKDEYKIGDVIWEKKNDGSLGNVRIDVKNKKLRDVELFIVGNEAEYFSQARYSFEGDMLIVRFDLEDLSFNPLDKELSFWLSVGNSNNYIHKQKVQKMSLFDTKSSTMSWGILGFAFLGGILLNLMPCVFPVLSLKLLNYSLLGNLTEKEIRRNFIFNTVGILVSFAVMAAILSGLKIFGVAIGWGMQFQNIIFLTTVLWAVVFFFYFVCGLLNMKTPDMGKKINKYSSKRRTFEFLSGAFLVLLSTPCMAPYLGTAFGIALAGDVKTIITTVMLVGLGLSFPYILIAIFPKIATYIPRPGVWIDWINILMVTLLFVTIIWLLSILVAQTSVSQIWHWILYILLMTFVLYFWKVVRKEIYKHKGKKLVAKVNKMFACVFLLIILLIMGVSYTDAIISANIRKEYVSDNYKTKLNISRIERLVKNGHKVLVKVGADWCLTCKFNDVSVFNLEDVKDDFQRYGISVIDVDWTNYQPKVLKFMQEFGRSGLPFYVFFSPRYPKGVVLSEIVNYSDIKVLIEK